jgi:hypothetical protein
MDEIVWKKLENLEMAGLAETAEKLLPPLVQIDNPKEAAGRVAALANLPPEAATEIEALALQTAHSSLKELTGLLRAVIADMASNAPDGGAAVSDAADAVGRKQIVVGPEIYGICTLLIAGYILIRTGGKKATTRDIEISEDGNGKTMVRIREHTEFLNPFGPLATLLKRITGDVGSSDV